MSYSDWHPSATPDHQGFNCMQLLSGTFYEGQWMTFECYDDFIDTHALCQLKYTSSHQNYVFKVIVNNFIIFMKEWIWFNYFN